jgi:outer membrane protein assembly factor BamB
MNRNRVWSLFLLVVPCALGAASSERAFAAAITASGTLLQTFVSPDRPNTSNAFGTGIAAAQDSVFISDVSLPGGATVYQFDRQGSLLGRITNPIVAGGLIGSRMQVLGDTLFVHGVGDGSSAGAIYRFDPITRQYEGRIDPPASGFQTWGSSLARSGDLLIVGNVNRYVPVYDLTTGQIVRQFNDPAPSESNFFGKSIEVLGDTVFISAPQEMIAGSGAGNGVVHAFNLQTAQYLYTLGGQLDDPNVLGEDMAIVGDNLLVGDFDVNEGRAYLFNAQTSEVLERYGQPTGTSGAWFGSPVAGIGETIVIGAQSFQRPGAVYFYDAAGQLLDTIDAPIQDTDRMFARGIVPWHEDLLVSAPAAGTAVPGFVYLFSTPVPEPSSLCLAALGLAALALARILRK